MNQLARNQQVEAARRRLAARRSRNPGIPAGAQNMNLAGCGGPRYNQGAWAPVHPGGVNAPWTPYPVFEAIPNEAPPLNPGAYVGPGDVIRQQTTPCGVIVQADPPGSTTVEVAPQGGALFYGGAISTCNDCFQVLVESITTGSLEYDLIGCGPVDAAIWNTDECYCPMDIGCFWTVSPLTISFSAFGAPSVPPFLNLTIWGVKDSGYRDCGLGPLLPFWGGAYGAGGFGAMGGAAGGGMVAPGGGGGMPIG